MDLDTCNLTLEKPDAKGTRYWNARAEGAELIVDTWTGTGKAKKQTRKTLKDEQQARREYFRAVDKKMAEGFVFRRDIAQAAAFELVLDLCLPMKSRVDVFDLHPSKPIAAIATPAKDANDAAIHLVDLVTGELRTVHTEPGGEGQTFIHAVLFERSGSGLLFAVNEDISRFDLETSEFSPYTAYGPPTGKSRFNPHCLRPAQDQRRERLLCIAGDDELQVLDEKEALLLRHPLRSIEGECRLMAISPSGRLVAVYATTRFLASPGSGREINHVVLLEVDSGAVRSLPIEPPLDALGISPDDQELVVSIQHARGPFLVNIANGEMREGPHNPDWDDPNLRDVVKKEIPCSDWRFSRDGRRLAVAGKSPLLFSAQGFENTPLELFVGGQCLRVRFSSDEHLLVAGDDSSHLRAFKLPANDGSRAST